MRVQNSELYSNAYLKLWQKGYVKDKAYWVVKPSSLLKEMPLPSNSKNGERFVAFDLLCGQGRNIQFLIEMGYEVFSIDILPEAISSVRTSFSANVNPVCSDAIDFLTDCKSLSVDLLFANHLIQHLITFDKLHAFMVQLKRIVKIGSSIALAYFVEPRHIHPESIRELALILPKKYLVNNYFQDGNFSTLHYDNFVVNDEHVGEKHQHAVERVIVTRLK